MLNFWGITIVFHSSHTISRGHQQCVRVPISPQLTNTHYFLFLIKKKVVILINVKKYLTIVLICISIMEKEMATHSSVLAWRIPGTGEPGGLLSMESHRVGHDWRDLAAAAAVTNNVVHPFMCLLAMWLVFFCLFLEISIWVLCLLLN